MREAYETVIGLEVHVQLNTQTKIFCGCPTTFGAPPNSQVCPVCLGLPGALPVLNRQAFELTLRTALALHCQISERIKFDRKNYFYPDLPKNYQISQYDLPVSHDGWVDAPLEDRTVRVRIHRAHLEEDAGKLLHEGVQDGSLVDFNRAGIPLLEIVSEPDLTSSEAAHAYLTTLKTILQYLDVSDCNMEEGSLRCDVNLSVRRAGAQALGTKVEIKNLNSFKAVRAALVFEQHRQQQLLDRGERIVQETRLWDAKRELTASMRSKEEASDYRYFPEPDLVPFEVARDALERIRTTLPELPHARAERFMQQYGLPPYDAHVLTADKAVAEFFEATVTGGAPAQPAAHWVMGEVLSFLNAQQLTLARTSLQAAHLARLIGLVERHELTRPVAKEVFVEMARSGQDPQTIIAAKGWRRVADPQALATVVDQVLAEQTQSVADYRRGKTTALMYLVGQCMKATRGQADPTVVAELLRQRLTNLMTKE